MKKKIEWLITGTYKQWIEDNYSDGGYVYDTNAREALRRKHELNVTYLSRGGSRNRFARIAELLWYLARSAAVRIDADIVVRDPFFTAFSPFSTKRKEVVLFHHIDVTRTRHKGFNSYFARRFFQRAKRADCVVAVSEYWQEVMREKGCRDVRVIYNAFDIDQFKFSPDELHDFARQYDLPAGKPIVYLGNAKQDKGFEESYNALKEMDAVLVATGRHKVNIPVRQMFLDYSDYLKLLAISSLVVTMSQFEEGWCRNAHEAMLCGTPVIGSGRGGMRELLEKGGQIICNDFRDLSRQVEVLLADEEKRLELGGRGRKFASQFDMKYFDEAWLGLITSL